jgi:hypothetical protein
MNTWELHIRLNDRGFASMHPQMKQVFETEVTQDLLGLLHQELYTPLTFLGWNTLHLSIDEAVIHKMRSESLDI